MVFFLLCRKGKDDSGDKIICCGFKLLNSKLRLCYRTPEECLKVCHKKQHKVSGFCALGKTLRGNLAGISSILAKSHKPLRYYWRKLPD